MRKNELHREPQELLADYADALRDGRVPGFLRTLTRQEAKAVTDSDDLGRATDMARLLNQAAFADKAVWPDVGLFIARVDAKIASRSQHRSSRPPIRHKGVAQSAGPSEDTAEPL